MKNEVKTFYFGDHIRTWTVISEKKKNGCHLSNQRAARGFNSFVNLARRVKSLPTPALTCFKADSQTFASLPYSGVK